MDPNENIKRQRELAQLIFDLTDHTPAPSDEHELMTAIIEKARELAELVQALDVWRRTGGFDPYTGIGKRHIVVVSWKSPDSDAWVFGTYDRPQTEEEMKRIRQVFMEETGTSELDWEEFGCEIKPSILVEIA